MATEFLLDNSTLIAIPILELDNKKRKLYTFFACLIYVLLDYTNFEGE